MIPHPLEDSPSNDPWDLSESIEIRDEDGNSGCDDGLIQSKHLTISTG
jgi:hypothetical protein